MMRTIQSLIDEKKAYNRATRNVALEDRIRDVYLRYPDLESLDSKIVQARRDRLMARFEGQEVTYNFLEEEGKELLLRRERFIKDNGIDPEFDKEIPTCSKCGDTGFVKTAAGSKVCTCMKRELEECFTLCGLKDFSTYTEKGLDMSYFDDKAARTAQRDRLVKLIMHKAPLKDKGLWILSAPPQSGKTYLTVCMVKAAIRLGKSAAYIKAEQLDDLSDRDLEFLKQCEFLAIDDYSGEVTASAGRAYKLNEILEVRMSQKAATLIVTPFSREDAISRSDVRIAAKLSGAGTI